MRNVKFPNRNFYVGAPLLASAVFVCLSMILSYFVVNQFEITSSDLAAKASSEVSVQAIAASIRKGVVTPSNNLMDISFGDNSRVSSIKVMPFALMFDHVKDSELQSLLRSPSGSRPVSVCGNGRCLTGMVYVDKGTKYVILAESYRRVEDISFVEFLFLFPVLFVMLTVIIAGSSATPRTSTPRKPIPVSSIIKSAEDLSEEFDRTEYEDGYRRLSRDLIDLSEDVDSRMAGISKHFSGIRSSYGEVQDCLGRLPRQVRSLQGSGQAALTAADSIINLIDGPDAPLYASVLKAQASSKEFASSLYRIHLLTLPLESQVDGASFSVSEFKYVAREVMTAITQSETSLADLSAALDEFLSIIRGDIYRTAQDIKGHAQLMTSDALFHELMAGFNDVENYIDLLDIYISSPISHRPEEKEAQEKLRSLAEQEDRPLVGTTTNNTRS